MKNGKCVLEIQKDSLTLGGKPFYLASGSFHYFRTLPGGWRKRLELMKDFGLTAVQTYVPWNLHEPDYVPLPGEGRYDFTGRLDLAAFLALCDEVGLKVMLRPTPYICSECDMGGLPWWLLKEEGLKLRCSDPKYLAYIERYYKRLCTEFVPYLSTNGGPVIAVCLENEYGSYGNDKQYLRALEKMLQNGGVDVPLYTTDGGSKMMLKCGTLAPYWAGVNYRIESASAIAALRGFQPDKPPYIGEYWSGRASQWDEPFSHREIGPIADAYQKALELGGLLNFYMFCGGTNFGFFSGADYGTSFSPRPGSEARYIPLVTSYECDALISEQGTPTPKYYACRAKLDKFLGKPVRQPETPAEETQEVPHVALNESWDLLDHVKQAAVSCVEYAAPPTFEELNVGYGYVLYSTYIYGPSAGERTLELLDLHDRTTVYLDGKYIGWAMRDRAAKPIVFDVPEGGARLDILVENMGRVCFGSHIGEHCGILGGVRHGVFLFNWTVYALPMKEIPDCYQTGRPVTADRPAFFRGRFRARAGVDTFVRLDGWDHGFVMINGFNLGRYWKAGPQKTLYLPGELLQDGENTVEVFEVRPHAGKAELDLVGRPLLDAPVGENDAALD